MKLSARLALLGTLAALPLLAGCDKKEAPSSDDSSTPSSPEDGDKNEKVNALLRANGIDPATL